VENAEVLQIVSAGGGNTGPDLSAASAKMVIGVLFLIRCQDFFAYRLRE
jgi:hypothetical protein